jgi:NAD(P)-dependent dehydrogenase (short-subunit alcohol dehydrogenase family)/uncharacterized protein YndB with AHSA1/START domain
VARNRVHIAASPERVFAVLADPRRYPEWVVGASDFVDADPEFPAPGARFQHRVGIGPLRLSDHTEAVEVEPPRRIVLKAKARPLGTAMVEIELREAAGGTEVAMEETPGDRLSALVTDNPLGHTSLRVRNAVALSRLKRVVEERPVGPPTRSRELAGARVLITGGSSGIGLATAGALAAAGAHVALLARNEVGLAEARRRVRERLGGLGGDPEALGDDGGGRPAAEPFVFSADIRDRDALTAAVDEAAEALGGLDAVVAGAASIAFGPFVETDAEDFDATVETILLGTANTIRAALPHLERSRGALVVIGSVGARLPLPALPAYSAAKHGVAGLVDALRIELAESRTPVSVSLVNPGPVDTPLWSHLQSDTGLLPLVPPTRYTAATVAEAIVATIRRPREEVTVGGAASLQVASWRALRGLAGASLVVLDRLFEAGEDREAEPRPGALETGRGEGRVEGGFGGRPSLAVKAMGAWDGLRRRAGVG